jgi:hypothetical protein
VIRLLGPGDEGVLRVLAEDEADFDLVERDSSRGPLTEDDAQAYLRDPAVLHWVAEEDGGVVLGHLLSYVERRRAGPPAPAPALRDRSPRVEPPQRDRECSRAGDA